MSRYFDLDDERIVYDRNSGEYAIYCVPLDMQPTDIEEVVHCKDCVYYKGLLSDCCHVMCPMDFVPEDDDYCSWGVKWTEDMCGKWKEKNSHTRYCSECGFEETIWRTSEYNFCPKCGTRMVSM